MVDKKQLIQMLDEISVLLELKGANPFKVRAYANASRALQGLNEDIGALVSSGKIADIKGIGKGLAGVITEILSSGKSGDLEQLKAEIPAGLTEMLKIPGMGPKKVKAVWEKLSLTTVGELEYACKENRLVDLEGFGAKTQQKIFRGIELLKKYADRHLLPEAMEEADILFENVRSFSGVNRAEIAGSLRRQKETVKDIDIVLSAQEEARERIMEQFTALSRVEVVHGKGLTKSSVMLKSGINADLRIVDDSQYPYALHHFTGSKEHNVALRERAKKLNLKLNEYGLFRQNDQNIECHTESDIFEKLGLQYIPPELRENMGEIEAAAQKNIPELVTQKDILGIIHTHTVYSDGANSISEMAEACQAAGYRYLVISDHSHSAFYANGLSPERILRQHTEIDALNRRMKNFRILKSIESDILIDGSLDYPDEILAGFDLVIASIHSRFKMTEAEATERLIKAMENPYVTILGHPTGRLLLAREGYPVDMLRVIDAAAALGVAIELNANPHRLDIDWRLLKSARNKGVKISINPDAHRIEGFGDIRYGVGIARKGWLTPSDVLNCLPAGALLEFANRRRP